MREGRAPQPPQPAVGMYTCVGVCGCAGAGVGAYVGLVLAVAGRRRLVTGRTSWLALGPGGSVRSTPAVESQGLKVETKFAVNYIHFPMACMHF